MNNNYETRLQLIDDINWLCEALNMSTPEGFPGGMTDEDMIKWLGIWDEFDPLPDDDESPSCYILCDYDTPVCNHMIGLTKENQGYTSGVMIDGVPFEAEIYEYETDDGKNVDIGIILPVMNDLIPHKGGAKTKGNIVGFEYEVYAKYNGVLNLGMVDDGVEEDDDIIHWYVEYVEQNELIQFVSNTWNGSVQYCTDSRGMELAYVAICLTISGNVQAHTNLKMHDFPMRKSKKTNLKVVK